YLRYLHSFPTRRSSDLIDAAVGQAYVVNDALDLAGGNLVTDRLLDQIAKIGGFLDAHSRGRTQMQLERAAVDAGKEIPAEPRNRSEEHTSELQSRGHLV